MKMVQVLSMVEVWAEGGSGAGKGEGKVGAALTAFHGLYSRVLLLNTAAVLKWRDVVGVVPVC